MFTTTRSTDQVDRRMVSKCLTAYQLRSRSHTCHPLFKVIKCRGKGWNINIVFVSTLGLRPGDLIEHANRARSSHLATNPTTD
ncbi:unnamed protein product [Nezara viridula]|uniref:Uncharacterized protein n=1 Tax=Nezara viridula TaxID=85310 RepID=A0A9P0H3K3_NEZVI|nr:unnamed protein product [Nezara viridula]